MHFSEPVYGDSGQTSSIDQSDFPGPRTSPLWHQPACSEPAAPTGPCSASPTRSTAADVVPYTSAQTLNAVAEPSTTSATRPSTPGPTPTPTWTATCRPAARPCSPPLHAASLGRGPGLRRAGVRSPTGPQTQVDPLRGGTGRITRFDGSAWLQDRDTQLQVNIQGLLDAGIAAPAGADPVLRREPRHRPGPGRPAFLQRLWIPSVARPCSPTAGHDRLNNGNRRPARCCRGCRRRRAAARLPHPVLRLRDQGRGRPAVPAAGERRRRDLFPLARIDDPLDPRTARPWSWKVRDLRAQRGEVTILNNVINPLRGEKAGLYYTLSNTGYVTITVFDLKGDIVNVLYRGQRARRGVLHHLGRAQPGRAHRGPRPVLHQGGRPGRERDPQGAGGQVAWHPPPARRPAWR